MEKSVWAFLLVSFCKTLSTRLYVQFSKIWKKKKSKVRIVSLKTVYEWEWVNEWDLKSWILICWSQIIVFHSIVVVSSFVSFKLCGGAVHGRCVRTLPMWTVVVVLLPHFLVVLDRTGKTKLSSADGPSTSQLE